MMRLYLCFLTAMIVLLLTGCGTTNPILATIGDEKITLHEFEDNYVKNSGSWDSSAVSSDEDRRKFLDLYLKFRLKVKEAYSRGLNKIESVKAEIDSNNNIVAQAYMIEKEVAEPGLKNYYNRKKEEVRASHILIRIPKTNNIEDTLKAYTRAMEIISKIKSTPFDSLAYHYSDDPSAKTNYGDLGYFIAGRMVPEFDDACYSLRPGQYTKKPIRTSFGYHIIKVVDRRPNRGSVRLSVILLRFDESLEDTAAVRDTADMIYNRIKNGEDFVELAKKYSQDRSATLANADIGFIELSRIPQNMADDFYNAPIGSVVKPIKFNYGYQIFKVTDKMPFPNFEESEKTMRTQYQQIVYKTDYQNYLKDLNKKYNVLIDSAIIMKVISSIDSSKRIREEFWRTSISDELMSQPVIRSNNILFTTKNFFEEALAGEDTRVYQLNRNNIWLLVNKAVEKVALRNHVIDAPKRYPELAKILKEFEEGILLFHIEQEEVWGKLAVNDSVLKEYYELHKENYRWPNRVNFAEIFVLSDSLAKAIHKKVKKTKDFMAVAEEYTKRTGYKEKKGEWGFQPFDLNELSKRASTMKVGTFSEPFKYEKGWSIIKTLAIDSARIKTFEEATPELIGAYQEEASKKREKEFFEMLKQKYPITINEEVLTQAFKRKRDKN